MVKFNLYGRNVVQSNQMKLSFESLLWSQMRGALMWSMEQIR